MKRHRPRPRSLLPAGVVPDDLRFISAALPEIGEIIEIFGATGSFLVPNKVLESEDDHVSDFVPMQEHDEIADVR
jgi:hypothetical protein